MDNEQLYDMVVRKTGKCLQFLCCVFRKSAQGRTIDVARRYQFQKCVAFCLPSGFPQKYFQQNRRAGDWF